MKRLTMPKDCCIETMGEDDDSAVCMTCQSPLVRCMAFAECGGLVGEDGLCKQCSDSHLVIVPGATMHAPIGGSVAIPFILQNSTKSGRPLFVTGLWSREKGEEWRPERLGWEKLNPGSSSTAAVTAREIDAAGLHAIEIMYAVSTRWRTREEHFVFATRVLLTIAGDEKSSSPTIQISSQNEMNGNVIQIHEREKSEGDDGRVIDAIDMNLDRLDKDERSLGLRGMKDGSRVTAATVYDFEGFAPEITPRNGLPMTGQEAMLAFGRSHLRSAGGTSDVQLAVNDTDGNTDESLSVLISRRHFELYVQNDRLMLCVMGRHGLRVNGDAYGPDKIVMLQDGDRIAPLVQNADAMQLSVRFRYELDKVSRVILSKAPAQMEASQ